MKMLAFSLANSENDKDLAQNQFSNIIEQLRKVNSVYRHSNRTDIDIECAANVEMAAVGRHLMANKRPNKCHTNT